MYTIKGLKVAYIIFHMFLGMVKETSKDKRWSMGSKESAAGQGEGHTKCDSPRVVKSAITITLYILPEINIEVQYIRYTREYIPKLQIHQQLLNFYHFNNLLKIE